MVNRWAPLFKSGPARFQFQIWFSRTADGKVIFKHILGNPYNLFIG